MPDRNQAVPAYSWTVADWLQAIVLWSRRPA